jgi:hypothetical protein
MDSRSPFHQGERDVQARVGVREHMEQIGQRILRDAMPDQHRELFMKLPTIFIGTMDEARRPWASVLFGEPGFLESPDATTLAIDAPRLFGDPAAKNFVEGAPVGVLGIQPETRRRNRMNGSLVFASSERLVVHTDQSFGNCPKFIERRTPSFRRLAKDVTAARAVTALGAHLDESAKAIVARANTFFLASASPDARAGDMAEGVDVSHRGGPAGFVTITETHEGTELSWPDFEGNYLFNTLGNLARWPHAGLLFLDYATGDVLTLTCDVETRWTKVPASANTPAAERSLVARVVAGALLHDASPLCWFA